MCLRQQMQTDTTQLQESCCFLFAHCRRVGTQPLRQRSHNIPKRIPRTRRYDELALAQQFLGFVPGRNLAERVDPNQKVQAVALAQPSLDSPYGVDRVARSAL